MAHVRDIRLMLGMTPDFQQMAEVAFAVEFSQAEVNQNINFGLYVSLLQYDPRNGNSFNMTNYQTPFFSAHNGHQPNQTTPYMSRDNGIFWVAREVIRPNATKTHYFQRKCTFQRQLQGNYGSSMQQGDYTAYVMVIPEITEGRGWSNVYRLGQGQTQAQVPFGAYMSGQTNGQYYDQAVPAAGFSNGMI